jgi:hypothetical protein
LAFAVCKLFPSPVGTTLNIDTDFSGNFAKNLNKYRMESVTSIDKNPFRKDIEILAGLLFCIVNNDKGIKGNIAKSRKNFFFSLENFA